MFITRGEVIHTIHGDNLPCILSTFCRQEIRRTFHRVIHDDSVHKRPLHLLDSLDEFVQDTAEFDVGFFFFADFIAGMQYRSVVTATEEVANLRQRRIGEFAAEVHGNLARVGNAAGALLGVQIINFYLDLNLASYEIEIPVLKMSWVGVQSSKSEGKRR